MIPAMAAPPPALRRLRHLVSTLSPTPPASTSRSAGSHLAGTLSPTPPAYMYSPSAGRPAQKKILVIADVHGNASALRAVLERETDTASTVFLGDSVLSGPQVRETMALLRSLHASKGGVWISGNHDEEMLHPELLENYPPTWKALNDWIFSLFEPSDYEFVR